MVLIIRSKSLPKQNDADEKPTAIGLFLRYRDAQIASN